MLLEAATYTAKYRDGVGLVVKVATGCRSLDAAKRLLVDLETRADKVRSGSWTAAEDSVMVHQSTPIREHLDAYFSHLESKRGKGSKERVSPRHVANVKRCLNRIVADCRFKSLREMNRKAMERWVRQQTEQEDPPSARTINSHLVALTAFGNWCVEHNRLLVNPFTRPPKLDEKADRRRRRRALTEDELDRLLNVA